MISRKSCTVAESLRWIGLKKGKRPNIYWGRKSKAVQPGEPDRFAPIHKSRGTRVWEASTPQKISFAPGQTKQGKNKKKTTCKIAPILALVRKTKPSQDPAFILRIALQSPDGSTFTLLMRSR